MLRVIYSFWRLEGGKIKSIKYIAGLILLVVVGLAFVQYHTNEYINSVARIDNLKNSENKIDQFYKDRICMAFGSRFILLPAPISIFSNKSTTISNFRSLLFNKDLIWKSWDFCGMILIIGCWVVIFYGCYSLAHEGFMRFLASFTSIQKVFWGIYISRVIWIFIISLFITMSSLLLIFFNGIIIPIDMYVFVFFLNTFLILLFFFSLGFACGIEKPGRNGFNDEQEMHGVFAAIFIWVFFTIFFPILIEGFAIDKARNRAPVNGLQETDEATIDRMTEDARFTHLLSCTFPTTYYRSVNNELSSCGLNEMIGLCRFAKRLKIEFVHMDRVKKYFVGYSIVKAKGIKTISEDGSKIRDDINIYTAHPSLPEYFFHGIIISFLYISASVVVAYYRFKNALYKLPPSLIIMKPRKRKIAR